LDFVCVGYVIGEVGGFNIDVGSARICPVQTAEKGKAWLRLTARGPSGHGSMPMKDSTVVRLSEALVRLGKTSLPQHNTPVAEAFIRGLADLLPYPERLVLPKLLWEKASGVILDKLIKDPSQARNFNAMLHNTVSATVVRAGDAPNVIPDSAEAQLDGRLLPGMSAADLVAELRAVAKDDELQVEVLREAPAVMNHPPDSPLWACILDVMGKRDPTMKVLPYMIPGYTDASWFTRLGARWYGFSPIKLDTQAGPSFADLFHGIDERIPEDGFHWGLGALWEVVRQFAAAE
jgi:acetylornithine deacetylase/succinyl-diaminopimelate desuccinylase-like protein